MEHYYNKMPQKEKDPKQNKTNAIKGELHMKPKHRDHAYNLTA